MNPGEAAVRFSNVDLRLGSREVLKSLDLAVPTGETVVLLGRSGSGKTSALRLINRMLTADGGEVRVFGRPVSDWDPIELRRKTGYVVQEAGLFPHLTVAENVGLLLKLEGWTRERQQARVEELLSAVGMPYSEFGDRKPRQLSGGQKQRVGIARALALDPSLLLFDEPFSALDPVLRRELQDQFLDLQRRLGKTSVFVTHDLTEALRIASRIAVLKEGRLEAFATPSEFVRIDDGEAAAFLRSADTPSFSKSRAQGVQESL
jgi:osmoprotectant transport system ATP-binding protein